MGCHRKDANIEFYVKDTGIGIAQNKLNSIFERFIQADEHLSRGYEGAGLGLAISKAYSEMLGGKISVESQLGIGTIFTLTLPIHFRSEKEPQIEKVFHFEKRQQSINDTILIVEDDNASLKFLIKIMENFNFPYLIAQTGYEAVAMCKSHEEIKLILMDIKLPGLDGYSAAKMIREFRPKIPIIAQTAFALSTDSKKFGPVFNAYVTKPIRSEVLIEKIVLFLK